jgi:hypothetical protein
MRSAVGLILVGACVWATTQTLPMWSSDRTLWKAAVRVTDTPRAAVNRARVALVEGDVDTAIAWDIEALSRALRHPADAAIVTSLVRQHLRWILATSPSSDLCTVPPWASWCASL